MQSLLKMFFEREQYSVSFDSAEALIQSKVHFVDDHGSRKYDDDDERCCVRKDKEGGLQLERTRWRSKEWT